MTREKRQFLWSFHYFRAFAILNIVFIHTWRFSSKTDYLVDANFVNAVRDMLFHGSTIYFLFISGFLFHYLSHKFQIRKYYLSKFKNVVVPYVFISVFLIFSEDFTGAKANVDLMDYLYIIPEKLIRGTASFQFWYIPFILIVFLLSPIFLAIKEKTFLKVVPWLFLLPILGTRTTVDITIGQFVYFLPTYLVGMYTSMNFEYVMQMVKKRFWLLTVIAVATSFALLWVDHEKVYLGFTNPRESLVYLQKIAITFIILHLSRNIQENKFPSFSIVADCSFALYFTHVIFDRHLKKVYYLVDDFFPHVLQVPASIVYVILLITVNVLFCLAVKKVLGEKSRYFIGY
ncbi:MULTISPECIES: acyltransferase family protein [Flavobacteriaceae]|uniref:acyltransferase family protein n=1 Tax=Flavobacteriaceae TaxID=49546 RepID=UPI001492C5B0|nr:MULTISPECIES: acyltransferase [Allomuricauda]MDC6366867.1 acyltransferase [Muricauda sp. AC10]